MIEPNVVFGSHNILPILILELDINWYDLKIVNRNGGTRFYYYHCNYPTDV